MKTFMVAVKGFSITACLLVGFFLLARSADTMWMSDIKRTHVVLVYLFLMFLLYPMVGLAMAPKKRR